MNINISTINFVLVFIGYPLATSLFLPVSSDLDGISRIITVPYRAFALGISIFVLLLNIKTGIRKLPVSLVAFLLFWFLLIIRILYDIYIRRDVVVVNSSQILLYVFGICLPAIVSVIVSYKFIDLDKAFYWIFWGTAFILFLSLFSNQVIFLGADEMNTREGANVALQSISYGQLSATGILLALFLLLAKKTSLIKKIVLILVLIIFSYTMFRAGSRSPLLSIVIAIIFWLFVKGKNVVLGFSVSFIFFSMILVFKETFLTLIGKVSVLMEMRLRAAIYEGDTSERGDLYQFAIDAFLENPVLGKQFAIFGTNSTTYAHNIVLDALMGLGIMGGILMVWFLIATLVKVYKIVLKDKTLIWIGLLLVQQVVLNMISGAFYYNQKLNVLIVFILMYVPIKQIRIKNVINDG